MNNTLPEIGTISEKTQLLSIAASLTLIAIVGLLVRRGLLRSAYSIVWFLLTFVILIFSLSFNVQSWFSKLTGIFYPPAAILATLTVGIILISIHFSITLSYHERKISKLSQEIAILKMKKGKGRK